MDNNAIRVENVSKVFRLPHEKQGSLKSEIISLVKHGEKGYEEQRVLSNISFDIPKGEFFGIVGRNGSGKSTLLKLLAGIYTPTSGSIRVNGRLTPFIELGVGFNPELTGRENVFLNGALLGFNRKEMQAMYDDIVSFAEIERFMDQKLKNYSSGMQVRLAFSIAIQARSDILLIDEVLAVGDAAFQTKCFNYFYELKKSGATVVFVSHDQGSLERFCSKGILIDKGNIVEFGDISQVLKSYSKIVLNEIGGVQYKEKTRENRKTQKAYATILSTSTLDAHGKDKAKFQYGEKITVRYNVRFGQDVANPILGVTVWCRNVDKAVLATNTHIDKTVTGMFKKGDLVEFQLVLTAALNDGEYYVEPAVANESTSVFYDQVPKACTFYISGSNNPHAVLSNNSPIVLKRLPIINDKEG